MSDDHGHDHGGNHGGGGHEDIGSSQAGGHGGGIIPGGDMPSRAAGLSGGHSGNGDTRTAPQAHSHGGSDEHGAPVEEDDLFASASGMLSREQLLVMYGFVDKKNEEEWKEKIGSIKSENKRRAKVIALGKKVKEMVSQERTEVADEQQGPTGYPGGAVRWHLVLESATENVEETYFDILERIRQMYGFPLVYKVTDYFAASENSAFFGNSQQRLGLQQDRVQQFLANIGKFVKELFQMVRELRIIDERLEIYNAAGGAGSNHEGDHNFKHSPAADVTLKSIFTDLVEGGTKNPQSVFGLAQTVGFTLLPDLFFNEYVAHKEDVDARVDKLEYNKSIKAVLKRKLYQYLVWKEKTYKELATRRNFNLKYLRQHWTIIKLYMSWVKPYLRNIQRLTMNQRFMDSPDIVAAFEASFIEVEFIAARSAEHSGGYHPIVLATFFFRTRPDMSARKEYQQGPVHMGKMDMSLRAYAWTPTQLKAYRDMKRREEIELLGMLDDQLRDIMDALGEEFEKYLVEAGEEPEDKELTESTAKKKQDGALAPFAAVFGGAKDIVEAFIPSSMLGGHDHHDHKGNPEDAMNKAIFASWQTYHTFKKQKKLLTW